MAKRAYSKHTYKHRNAEVLVEEHSLPTGTRNIDYIIIAFRGTETGLKGLPDWITNAKTRRYGRAAGIHQGFWEYTHGLSQFLAPYHYSGKPTIITGHSLGGAAADIYYNYFGGDYCVTFGAPATGIHRSDAIRITAAGDAVPFLPLTYRHAKGPHWYLGPSFPLLDYLWRNIRHPMTTLRYHPMDNYQALLEKL